MQVLLRRARNSIIVLVKFNNKKENSADAVRRDKLLFFSILSF